MKIWKKSMIVLLAFMAISAVYATQYVKTDVKMNATVNQQHSDIQYMTGDVTGDNTSTQVYVLQNSVTHHYSLDLGTWMEGSVYMTYSAAFAVVNTQKISTTIQGVTLSNPAGGDLANFIGAGGIIEIWAHSHAGQSCHLGLESTKTLLYNSTGVPATGTWQLHAGNGYSPTSVLLYGNNASLNKAYWINNVYVGDTSVPFTAGTDNACWIEITLIIPYGFTTEQAFGIDLGLTFMTP